VYVVLDVKPLTVAGLPAVGMLGKLLLEKARLLLQAWPEP
jgi:hypothetical protein